MDHLALIRVPIHLGGNDRAFLTIAFIAFGVFVALLLITFRFGLNWPTRALWGLVIGGAVFVATYAYGFENRPRSSFPMLSRPNGSFAGARESRAVPLKESVDAVSEDYLLENVKADLVVYGGANGTDVERRVDGLPAQPMRYHREKRWAVGPSDYISTRKLAAIYVELEFPNNPALDGKRGAVEVKADVVYPAADRDGRAVEERRIALDRSVPVKFAERDARLKAEPQLKSYDDAFREFNAKDDEARAYENALVPRCLLYGAAAAVVAVAVIRPWRKKPSPPANAAS